MIAERLIAAPTDAALTRILSHAMRHGRRARPGRLGSAPIALVTSDSDFAWVCRHVVADPTPAPPAFAADRAEIRRLRDAHRE